MEIPTLVPEIFGQLPQQYGFGGCRIFAVVSLNGVTCFSPQIFGDFCFCGLKKFFKIDNLHRSSDVHLAEKFNLGSVLPAIGQRTYYYEKKNKIKISEMAQGRTFASAHLV